MEKQMRAEREKRALIAESEGDKQAKINRAEGEKQQTIALSEGEKQTVITYMNHGLSKGNKLVIHKKTRKFNSFDDNDWNKILKNSKEDDWLVISENKITHKS